MARKIISKGSGSGSHSKRQQNMKGAPPLDNGAGASQPTHHSKETCRHSYNPQPSAFIDRRPFRSEINLFNSTTNPISHLTLPGQNGVTPNHNHSSHNDIVNANNGFIPISKQATVGDKDNNIGHHSDLARCQKFEDNGSEVTMFKTKVLYHSRSDFRPISLTDGQTNFTEYGEIEAKV